MEKPGARSRDEEAEQHARRAQQPMEENGAGTPAPFAFTRLEKGARARDSRHRVKAALATSLDYDAIAERGRPGDKMHTRARTPKAQHPKGQIERSRSGRVKHWKAPFWKRRNHAREQRALALIALAKTG